MTRGGRNLMLLGIIAAVVALTTTSVSLAIYHNSGDIYLDRSRPGFLPDKQEVEGESEEENYEFDKNGTVTKESLDEYLRALEKEIKTVDAYEKPFSADALSDEKLGI